jgi:endonuclease/exonuclease/phosphatase family metal-dependent hydrolase
VEVGSRSVRFIAVHLDTRLNPSERVLQLRPAVKDAPAPVVVAGDFNTNPMTWAFNVVPVLPQSASASDQAPILDDYMRSIDYQTPTASFGATVSFPGFAPRLDSIYVRGLAVGTGAVERSVTVSDHWPMWLDVEL